MKARRLVFLFLLGSMALGTIALFQPASARPCIYCPQIFIECGDCYNLMPQTCERCAYCKKIPGCHP